MDMQSNNAIQAALDFKTPPLDRKPTSALVMSVLLPTKHLSAAELAKRLDYPDKHPIDVALYKLLKKGVVERIKSEGTTGFVYRLKSGKKRGKYKVKKAASTDLIATMESALELMNESFAEFKKSARKVENLKKALMEMEG